MGTMRNRAPSERNEREETAVTRRPVGAVGARGPPPSRPTQTKQTEFGTSHQGTGRLGGSSRSSSTRGDGCRSEEHTSELQSRENLVCRLLLEKKKTQLYHLSLHK